MFLLSGGTVEQLRAVLLGSDEFFNGPGGRTGASFLNALYENVLGRAVDPAALMAVGGLANQGSAARTQIALAVLQSVEADTILVNDLYLQFLKRPADPLGLALAVNNLQHGAPDEAIIAVLIGSPEYVQAHQ
jgi:hypothetical protein